MKSFFSSPALLVAALLLNLVAHDANAQQAPKPVPAFKKIMWVWLENTSYAQMIQQKYVRTLFQTYPSARFSNYQPVSPITQANTFAMISGSDLGVLDNEMTRVFSPTLINLLEAKNVPWRTYVEEYPGSCYLNAGTGEYKRYRVPFLSLDRIQTDRYLCMKIVGLRNYDEDVKFGSLPEFTFVVPSLKGSGATSDAATADATLKRILDPVVTNEDFLQETTVFITTVSHKDPKKPEVFTMVLGRGLVPGYAYTINTPYNHYNLLRTLEDGFSLGTLNENDTKAVPMTGFWK